MKLNLSVVSRQSSVAEKGRGAGQSRKRYGRGDWRFNPIQSQWITVDQTSCVGDTGFWSDGCRQGENMEAGVPRGALLELFRVRPSKSESFRPLFVFMNLNHTGRAKANGQLGGRVGHSRGVQADSVMSGQVRVSQTQFCSAGFVREGQ
jgi:hypothetical protein